MEQNNNEIEIDFQEILFLLLDKIWIIGASTICIALIALIITKTAITPMYASDTKMYVLNKNSDTNVTYSDLQVSSQLTNDYVQFVKSRTVLQKVIDNLGLDMSVSSLSGRISVTTPMNTRMLVVTVVDEDPVNAKKIADTLAKYAGEYICEKMDTEGVNVVDEGNIPTSPTSPNTLKNTMIGALAGFVFAVGVIVVRYILDDTIKSEEDVERYLGCSMLAAIPYVDSLDDSIGKKKKVGMISNAKGKHR